MKNKLFITLLLGIIAVSGTSFCGEEQQPSQSYAQQAKNWLRNKFGKPEHAILGTAAGVSAALGASPGIAMTGAAIGGLGITGVGGALGGHGAVQYWDAIFSKNPMGVIQGATQLAMGLFIGAGGVNTMLGIPFLDQDISLLVATFSAAVINGLTANVLLTWEERRAKGKASDEQVIEAYKKTLELAIADPEAFPTIESKIYALNEPENLGLNINTEDLLWHKAKSIIVNEIQKNPLFMQIQQLKTQLKEILDTKLITIDAFGKEFIYNEALNTEANELKNENNTNALNEILIDALINKFRNTDEKKKRNTTDEKLNAWNKNRPYKAAASYVNCLKKQKVAEEQALKQAQKS